RLCRSTRPGADWLVVDSVDDFVTASFPNDFPYPGPSPMTTNPRPTPRLAFLKVWGLGLSLVLALGVPVTPVPAQPKQVPAALTITDWVEIAMEKQPALVAHRASVESAEAQARGLEELKLAAVISKDIPIRRNQAAKGVLIIQAGLAQAEWETAYAVSRTYLSAVYARAQLRVAEEDVNATQKN